MYTNRPFSLFHKLVCSILALAFLAGWLDLPATEQPATAAALLDRVDLVGPAGSAAFGSYVTVLANGNIVVTDPSFDVGGATDAGAVYLYDGATRALISTLTGTYTDDQIGQAPYVISIKALSNGNFVVISPNWGPNDEGAITWCSGVTGCNGEITISNSLMGVPFNRQVGYSVTVLNNGNYVVSSPFWDYYQYGAVTWCSGTTGCTGIISASNSLIGSNTNDQVGIYGVTALTNGNYVVSSPMWGLNDEGAITWCDGTTGCTGAISSSNSLVGSNANDAVGFGGVLPLSNGNFVALSTDWGVGDEGAATWADGTEPITGTISSANSLVGSSAGDTVGSGWVTELTNGAYVVSSPSWDNGSSLDAGAATRCSSTAGCIGTVSTSNSWVGGAENGVGYGGVTALTNGDYVIISPLWDSSSSNVGAITWVDGAGPFNGTVSAANSLVGANADDMIGSNGVIALSNGNYVVNSPDWGENDEGASTWVNAAGPVTGIVSGANSLVGSNFYDMVGLSSTALNNDHYVVISSNWGDDDEGAVTWCSGMAGCIGAVSASNSLVGSFVEDYVGEGGVKALSSGSYVVVSYEWGDDDEGAVTWCNGATGCKGTISASNSLVGSNVGDRVGYGLGVYERAKALSDGYYAVLSTWWGPNSEGAVTLGDMGGTFGYVNSDNSVIGLAASSGFSTGMNFTYDAVRRRVVVGRPADNIVTLVNLPPVYHVNLPIIKR